MIKFFGQSTYVRLPCSSDIDKNINICFSSNESHVAENLVIASIYIDVHYEIIQELADRKSLFYRCALTSWQIDFHRWASNFNKMRSSCKLAGISVIYEAFIDKINRVHSSWPAQNDRRTLPASSIFNVLIKRAFIVPTNCESRYIIGNADFHEIKLEHSCAQYSSSWPSRASMREIWWPLQTSVLSVLAAEQLSQFWK